MRSKEGGVLACAEESQEHGVVRGVRGDQEGGARGDQEGVADLRASEDEGDMLKE